MTRMSFILAAVPVAPLLQDTRLLPGILPWELLAHTQEAQYPVPSDEAVQACGVSGGLARDDYADLAVLCAPQVAECVARGSMARGQMLHRRRRRRNQLVLPDLVRPRACQCARLESGVADVACPDILPFLNVVVFYNDMDEVYHEPDSQFFFDIKSEWIMNGILPGFGRPMRVVHRKVLHGHAAHETPMLSNSIVLFKGRETLHETSHAIRLLHYVRTARAKGIKDIGLLHMDHELFCESKEEQASSACWWNTSEFLDAYVHFDYVLRDYYTPSYENHSHYLPLGPVSALARAPETLPKASERSLFCLATSQEKYSYRDERASMYKELQRHPELCVVANELPLAGYKAALLDTVFHLCPAGSNPETYRLWESILLGAIVVAHRATFIDKELHGAPFLILDDWKQLASTLEPWRGNRSALDDLQLRQRSWFDDYMAALGARLRAQSAMAAQSL